MALGVADSDDAEELQPQFFITLDDAPYLDGKHVCFGTVSGPTIFNALRIGRTEADESTHQPVDMGSAHRIKSVKLVENPIHQGLTPHPNPPWRVNPKTQDAGQPKKQKKKRKGKFDTNVLSFGSEFEGEDAISINAIKGMQSSHDVVESRVLSKEVGQKVKRAVLNDDDDSEEKRSIKKRRMDLGDNDDVSSVPKSSSNPSFHYSSRMHQRADESKGEAERHEKQSKEYSRKDNGKAPKEATKKSVSLVEARRLKYAMAKKSKKEREEETLNKLFTFRSTVQKKVEERKSARTQGSGLPKQDDSLAARMARRAQKADVSPAVEEDQAPTYHGQVLESDEDDDNVEKDGDSRSKWLATAFKCKRHVDHDSRNLGGDGRSADDYKVIDSKAEGRRHKKRSKHHKGSKHRHQGL